MAILESNGVESKSSSGFKKKINASSTDMIVENYQTILYKKPFASMVRESVSNALDAIREKHVALSILSGESLVSDHYVEKEGEMYGDSTFDPSYFDPQWLNKEDKVTLEYIVNPSAIERDLFRLKDTGVGLGGSRLQGFFEIGFSTKRLTANELGGFGIGAKSPLATNVASYRMISNYNGKQFVFDIFTHKFDCVHTKWGKDGIINDYVTWIVDGEERKVYYEKTEEQNSVIIELEIKKHNRKLVEEAVTTQLMYFREDITFTIIDDDDRRNVNFKVPILFENDDVIIPDNKIFNRPHFVMKGVCYGLIDFKELELDNRYGAIGIKVTMEEVEVVPSREEIKYGDKTRAAILLKYDRLVQTVTDMINKSVDVTDYLLWIKNCNNILYAQHNTGDRALNVLSNLVDKFALNLRFIGDSTIKYTSEIDYLFGNFLSHENVQRERVNRKGSAKVIVSKTKISSASGILSRVYLQLGSTSAKVTSYILDSQGSFTVLRPKFPIEELDDLTITFCNKGMDYKEYLSKGLKIVSEKLVDTEDKAYGTTFKNTARSLKLLLESPSLVKYEDVIVPDDFGNDDIIGEDEIEDPKEEYKLVVKQRRALGKFIVATPGTSSTSSYKTIFHSKETTGEDLEKGTVVYGTKENEDQLLRLAKLYYGSAMCYNRNVIYAYNDDFKIIRVAKSNLKHVKDLIHIDNFLLNIENRKLTVAPFIKNFLMGHMLHNRIEDNMKYFKSFEPFDNSLQELFNKLERQCHSDGLSLIENCKNGSVIINAFNYQCYQLNNPNATPEQLEAKFDELLGDYADKIDIIDIVDNELLEGVKLLEDFHRVYGVMLSNIGDLNGWSTLDKGLTDDIKLFLKSKIDLLEYDYPNLNL